jgi:hypothetical protein
MLDKRVIVFISKKVFFLNLFGIKKNIYSAYRNFHQNSFIENKANHFNLK